MRLSSLAMVMRPSGSCQCSLYRAPRGHSDLLDFISSVLQARFLKGHKSGPIARSQDQELNDYMTNTASPSSDTSLFWPIARRTPSLDGHHAAYYPLSLSTMPMPPSPKRRW